MKKRLLINIIAGLILLASFGFAIPQLIANGEENTVIWQNAHNYQQAGSIMVVADQRLFTTMSLFNAIYGYDKENASTFYPLRARVRDELKVRLANVPAEKVKEWSKFYQKKEYHIYYYIDYTMSLSGEYPFKKVLNHNENIFSRIAGSFSKPTGFEKIMNDFWIAMDLQDLWDEIYPDYLQEVKKFDLQRIGEEEAKVWQYLKMEKFLTGKTLVSIPNLIDSQYSAFGSEYPGYYFTISSPGSHDYGLNIHEYLHGILGPIVRENYKRNKDRFEPYLAEARSSEVVKNNYNNLETFVEECLVRAMEPRLRYRTGITGDWAKITKEIADAKAMGFNLTPIFFVLLEEFEESPKGFDVFGVQTFDQVPHLQDIR